MIIIFNTVLSSCSADDVEVITEQKSATVKCYDSGQVILATSGKDTTVCNMNLKYFPFDKHIGKVKFSQMSGRGVNTTNGYFEREGIVFQKSPVNPASQLFVQNGEWELLSLNLDTSPLILTFEEAVLTYPMYVVILELQRKSSFYVMTLMLPSVLISLISVIGFLLQSESGEKVSLQLTALLSFSLLLTVVVDTVPPIGGNFPLIGKFHLVTLKKIKKVFLSDRFV